MSFCTHAHTDVYTWSLVSAVYNTSKHINVLLEDTLYADVEESVPTGSAYVNGFPFGQSLDSNVGI